MAFRLIWSPSAKYDLKDIAAFIAEDRPLASENVIRNLFKAVERLSEHPESGRVVPEFDDYTIREVIYRPFRIVYRLNSKECSVEIARVWHGARGTPAIE